MKTALESLMQSILYDIEHYDGDAQFAEFGWVQINNEFFKDFKDDIDQALNDAKVDDVSVMALSSKNVTAAYIEVDEYGAVTVELYPSEHEAQARFEDRAQSYADYVAECEQNAQDDNHEIDQQRFQ